jgi:hypothetical protein
MATDDQMQFSIQRPSAPLPSRSDFDSLDGDLDAQCAWRNFGGLSMGQAYDLFLTNPLHYQEDFMFMGGRAFDYYFPVVDRYIREVTGNEDGDDCEVAILGSGVAAQFDWNGAHPSPSLINEIEALSEYVSTHLDQYSPSAEHQKRIKREWGRVNEKIAEYKSKSEQAVRGNPR